MTRSYYLGYVTDWCELIELCQDYDCDICEDVIDDDTLDEYVDSDISDLEYGWRRIRDLLPDIPTGYDYYRHDGPFDYVGLNNGDFQDYKSRILEWMDENDLWDAEDDEDDDEGFDPDNDFFSPGEPEDEPPDPPVEKEDFSVSELMCMCSAKLVSIRQVVDQRAAQIQEDDPFVLPF